MSDATLQPTWHRFLTAVCALVIFVMLLGLGLLGALSKSAVAFSSDKTHVLVSAGANVGDNVTGVYSRMQKEALAYNAELTRRYVKGDTVALPRDPNDRAGYNAQSVAHLRDVRAVIVPALYVVLGASVLLVIVLVVCLVSETERAFLRGCVWAGASMIALVVAGAILGTLNFSELFTRFHQLFFAEGTWLFAPDSLLIQTFPLNFWILEALIWAGITLFCSVLCVLLGVTTQKRVAKA